jgi:hypothetical protein
MAPIVDEQGDVQYFKFKEEMDKKDKGSASDIIEKKIQVVLVETRDYLSNYGCCCWTVLPLGHQLLQILAACSLLFLL